MLRQINELVDFSFVYDELKSNYCLDNGRNAIDPLRMFKYLLLKAIFELSDEDVVERSRYDMSFKYFLQMAPEDPVIDPKRPLTITWSNCVSRRIKMRVSVTRVRTPRSLATKRTSQ